MTATVQGKAVAVYEHLRHLAVHGGLRPGRRLVPPDVAEAFGVSHTPVREALARLAAEGFVAWQAGQGYYAKSYTAVEQSQLLDVGLGLLTTSMGAARRNQPTQMLEPFTRLELDLASESDGAARIAAAVEAFYTGMAQATGNAVLGRLSLLVAQRTYLVRRIDLTQRASAEVLVLALRAMAKALLVDDLEAAQRLGREVVRARQTRLEALVEQANRAAGTARFP